MRFARDPIANLRLLIQTRRYRTRPSQLGGLDRSLHIVLSMAMARV